jgi:predicted transcriptional regulator
MALLQDEQRSPLISPLLWQWSMESLVDLLSPEVVDLQMAQQ